jgi:ferredoxin--NADP+ reductase
MRVRPDKAVPHHKPGQYTVLGMGYWEPRFPGSQEENLMEGEQVRLARRSYSISCSILDDQGELRQTAQTEWLEFYIVLVRNSGKETAPALTPRLFLVREGERVYLGEKIAGHFTLDAVKPTDTVVFLGTGTGEAPHNYMVWQLLHRGHAGRILSACCVRYRKDLGYLTIQNQLMKRFPHYTYLGLTTREADAAGKKVYIQDLLSSGELERQLGRSLNSADTHVYLCGNPKMIGVPEKDKETGQLVYQQPPAVIELLVRRGFRTDLPAQKIKGNIHYEEYW